MTHVCRVVRWALAAFVVYKIFQETGFFTALFATLMVLYCEITDALVRKVLR